MDNPDKATCLQPQLCWLSFVFPWELTFHGRCKSHCRSPVKNQLLRGKSVGLTLHPVSCFCWAAVHPACCAFMVLVMNLLQTVQYLRQRLKQCQEIENIGRGMTYSKVQYNLKYSLWSKLYVGLVSVISSSEVFCSVLTPHSPAVSGRTGMAAAMLCVSRRNIDSSAFPLEQLVPSSCAISIVFSSSHCTNKSSFSGDLCSAAWAGRMGPGDVLRAVVCSVS